MASRDVTCTSRISLENQTGEYTLSALYALIIPWLITTPLKCSFRPQHCFIGGKPDDTPLMTEDPLSGTGKSSQMSERR